MPTVYEQLIATTKRPRKAGESLADFVKESIRRVDKLSDAQWGELSNDLQVWVNEAQKARELLAKGTANVEFPELEGLPEPSEEDEAAEPDAEAEAGEEAAALEGEEVEETPVEAEETAEESPEPKRARKPKAAKKAPAKAAKKAAKAPKAKAAKKAKRTDGGKGRPPSFAPDGRIKILVKKNPHREGSYRDKNFKVLKSGMTVEQALAAGCAKQQLWSMLSREVISIS